MSTHVEFYEQVGTYTEPVARHRVFTAAYVEHRTRMGSRPLDVLDVGCGEHAVLLRGTHSDDPYYGVDVKADIATSLERYACLDLDREDLASAWPGQTFDVVFCGEVIEHVFSPDRLLRQLTNVMHAESLLVLSTPNLAYWINRVLLALGISPLFVENSSEVVLGRRFRALGQGNATQGHLRLFTHRAMVDLLKRHEFRILRATSVPVWDLPGDGLICRVAPKLGPNSVFLLQAPAAPRLDRA
jgi:hypothetical protein